MSPTPQSSSELVIAIDFGTTFSGVAYAHTGAVSVADQDTARVAAGVEVIRTWPSVNQQFAEKTPSIIAYNTSQPTWGGSVKPQHKPQVSKFKLGLEAGVAERFKDKSRTDYGFHRELPRKSPLDFTADYLQCLLKFVKETALPRRFGDQFLLNQQLSYIVTVPAIWTDLAKQLTKEAVQRAGVRDSDKLVLLSEPEAAALYCATTCEEVDLNDGDIFLVCDAGGGTVVSTLYT
jgi:molecular chaperone DnaK (HSP70)